MVYRLGNWLLGYGAFLVAAGLTGYLSNPERAATALISGGSFGSLSIVWGLLLRGGRGWARTAAMVTTGFLSLVFAWRSTAGWLAVLDGRSEKLVAASLITAMLAASLVTLVVLARGGAKSPPGSAPRALADEATGRPVVAGAATVQRPAREEGSGSHPR